MLTFESLIAVSSLCVTCFGLGYLIAGIARHQIISIEIDTGCKLF